MNDHGSILRFGRVWVQIRVFPNIGNFFLGCSQPSNFWVIYFIEYRPTIVNHKILSFGLLLGMYRTRTFRSGEFGFTLGLFQLINKREQKLAKRKDFRVGYGRSTYNETNDPKTERLQASEKSEQSLNISEPSLHRTLRMLE